MPAMTCLARSSRRPAMGTVVRSGSRPFTDSRVSHGSGLSEAAEKVRRRVRSQRSSSTCQGRASRTFLVKLIL